MVSPWRPFQGTRQSSRRPAILSHRHRQRYRHTADKPRSQNKCRHRARPDTFWNILRVHRQTSCRHRHSTHLRKSHGRNMGYKSRRWCAKRGTHTGRASSCRPTSLRTTRPGNIFGHIGRHGNQRRSHQCSLFCFVQSTRRISIRRILTHAGIDIRSRLLSVV